MDLFGSRRAQTLGCGWRAHDSRLGGDKAQPLPIRWSLNAPSVGRRFTAPTTLRVATRAGRRLARLPLHTYRNWPAKIISAA
jgi:hypothetical protein